MTTRIAAAFAARKTKDSAAIAKHESAIMSLHSAMIKKRSSEAYVYAIGPEDNGPTKIGITATSVKSRLVGLQSSTWVDLRIFWAAEVRGAHAAAGVERAVHSALAERAIRGEWFSVGHEEARRIFMETVAGMSIEFKWVSDYGRCP